MTRAPQGTARKARADDGARELITDPGSRGEGRTQRQRMLAGDPYIADSVAELVAESQRARLFIEQCNRTPADAATDQRRILEELLGAFGAGWWRPATRRGSCGRCSRPSDRPSERHPLGRPRRGSAHASKRRQIWA